MVLFMRKPKPTAPPPQSLQAAPLTYSAPTQAPPPPYQQYSLAHTSTVPTAQISQQYSAQDDQSVSVEDFEAIQQAISHDAVVDQFSDIIANIDEDRWNENDEDFSIVVSENPAQSHDFLQESSRSVALGRNSRDTRRVVQPRTQKVTIWSKVSFYTNSTLPPDLPRLRVYIPTWPLICLAAQYSASAYKSPQSSKERDAFVSADARLGTKAMVMKSVPCDDKKTLVFAIRGTSTLSLRDWNVNLHTEPVSPAGFLDDEGNLCHEGFLRVAKAMIRPIAMRLRALLEENPSRASCSLLITGHSAGGAVAALLFSHMLSSHRSELSILADCFKRVHCVTFGAPPVSLLPLTRSDAPKCRKSLFFSFMNEGDPVVRAEIAYLRSLVDLISSPLRTGVIQRTQVAAKNTSPPMQTSVSKIDSTCSKLSLTCPPCVTSCNIANPLLSRFNFSTSAVPHSSRPALSEPRPSWPIPMATLSNAGRLVVMRVPSRPSSTGRRGTDLQRTTSNRWEKDNLSQVVAQTVTDEQLRQVMFGDPNMHAMEVYLRRVDMLALKAVTARA